jgi:hypothetical protein
MDSSYGTLTTDISGVMSALIDHPEHQPFRTELITFHSIPSVKSIFHGSSKEFGDDLALSFWLRDEYEDGTYDVISYNNGSVAHYIHFSGQYSTVPGSLLKLTVSENKKRFQGTITATFRHEYELYDELHINASFDVRV